MKTLFELADEEDLIVRAEYTPVDSEGRTIEPFLTALDFIKEKIYFPAYSSEILENIKLDSKSLPGSKAMIMSFDEASPNPGLKPCLPLIRKVIRII